MSRELEGKAALVTGLTQGFAPVVGPHGIRVLFLVSDAAAYMTGQTVVVDGGSLSAM